MTELTTAMQEKLMRRATLASVAVASLLVVVKFFAWYKTGSVSLLSSLIDSALDIVISVINALAIHYALLPPDREHRFGHTSAEDIATLAEAAFIAGSALFISIEAIGYILSPRMITHSNLGISVMAFSIIVSLLLVLYQRYVVRKTGSTIVEADSLHYITDLGVNFGVILAIILATVYKVPYIDPLIALIIVAYMLYGAKKIGVIAFDKLMDKEFDDDVRQEIINFVLQHENALGIHELKTRHSGNKSFIQFHLELDGTLTLLEAHNIADIIEKSLEEKYPGAEIIIHEDPVGTHTTNQ